MFQKRVQQKTATKQNAVRTVYSGGVEGEKQRWGGGGYEKTKLNRKQNAIVKDNDELIKTPKTQ